MKLFETFLGSQWCSWRASDTVSMKMIGDDLDWVLITTKAKKPVKEKFDIPAHPGHPELKTYFNLSVLPAYTIG